MTWHTIRGHGGVQLTARVVGPSTAPPIVLLHGWASSASVWAWQLSDPLLPAMFRLIAVDLRGHGGSETPEHGYQDAAVWAEDLAAVLRFAGRPALLVGWSYGGLVITDYLRVHGTSQVAGIVLVGAITEIGRGHPGARVGQAMRAALPAALSEDPEVAVPALTRFVRGMSDFPLPGELAQRAIGDCLRVTPKVRTALFRRDVSSERVLTGLDVPVLVVHGRRDAVVDSSAATYAAGKIPGARVRWFDGGHLPFVEHVREFNAMLLEFASRQWEGGPA
jgi:non-heme chloroperoxidase